MVTILIGDCIEQMKICRPPRGAWIETFRKYFGLSFMRVLDNNFGEIRRNEQ